MMRARIGIRVVITRSNNYAWYFLDFLVKTTTRTTTPN